MTTQPEGIKALIERKIDAVADAAADAAVDALVDAAADAAADALVDVAVDAAVLVAVDEAVDKAVDEAVDEAIKKEIDKRVDKAVREAEVKTIAGADAKAVKTALKAAVEKALKKADAKAKTKAKAVEKSKSKSKAKAEAISRALAETTKTGPWDLPSQLMVFRMAYLKAIADCWADEGKVGPFKDLVSDVKNEKGKSKKKATEPIINILEKDAFKKHLPKGFRFNWNANVFLIDTGKTTFEPSNIFSQSHWLGVNDIFVVKIPQRPADKKDWSQALMEYYRLFHSLLGSSNGADQCCFAKGPERNVVEVREFFKKFEVKKGAYQQAVEANTEMSLGQGGAENFLVFSAVFMQIIAQCWSSDNFRLDLHNSGALGPVGTWSSVLRSNFGTFSNPWSFSIYFDLVDDATWNSKTGHWEKLQKNEIYLSFPNSPKFNSSGKMQRLRDNPWKATAADAIARYNNTGPTYPFTCC